jgi:hypothetical protein
MILFLLENLDIFEAYLVSCNPYPKRDDTSWPDQGLDHVHLTFLNVECLVHIACVQLLSQFTDACEGGTVTDVFYNGCEPVLGALHLVYELVSPTIDYARTCWITLTYTVAGTLLPQQTNIINACVFTAKFLILITLLVFIRGGIPRYRYDFLTKIGWIKFLSLVLGVFLSVLLLNYIF